MAVTHEDRIRKAVNAFEEANAHLVRMLEGLNEEAARRKPTDGGWSPAQVGYHVAVTNELFAGVLSGAVRMAQPAPAGFAEDPNVFAAVPEKLKTLPPLEPPETGVTRADAIAKLRAAQPSLVAAIASMSAGRAGGQVMQLPFGSITLYQAAEFLGAHTARHAGQIRRCTAGA